MPPRSGPASSTRWPRAASTRPGAAADWARTAAEQIERLADRAQQLGPKGVADEVATFARRRPLAFLAGAAAAGFVVGRLARNAGQSADGPVRPGVRAVHHRSPRARAGSGAAGRDHVPIASPAPVGDPLVVGAGRIDV